MQHSLKLLVNTMTKTFRIKKEYGEAWMDALATGGFKQGFAGLHNIVEDSYCCLGVACVMAGTKTRTRVLNDDIWAWAYFGEEEEWTVLPRSVAEKFGLTDMQGNIVQDPLLGPHPASDWNDEYGATFSVIVELIEHFGEFYA